MGAHKGLYSGGLKGKKMKQPAAKRKIKQAALSIKALKQTQVTARADYGRPEKTREGYDGYVQRGQAFLTSLVANQHAEGNGGIGTDGVDTTLLKKAFENPPNEYSLPALEWFLIQKCFTEGLGKSTASGIQGAFTDYWDNMDGDLYVGPYTYDRITGGVTGNPGRAPSFQSYIKIVTTKGGATGAAATRHHTEAMTIEDLTRMMGWSEDQYSSNALESPPKDVDELLLAVKHGMMQAFASTGNFELCGLQGRHIIKDCQGPAPYYVPHFKVHLENRKGWQQKAGYDGPLESNVYDIYKQDVAAMDMSTHLPRWVAYLEQCLGHQLQPDDYVFPFFSKTRIPQPSTPMTHAMVQSLISEFASVANLSKIYTTHCFRRGGAQYCFMYTPISSQWSLSIIRWWGGWAIGEHVDMLMKYLIDSLQSYETGHGDALAPIPREADKSFMGEHVLIQSISVNDFCTFADSVLTSLNKRESPPCTSRSSSSPSNSSPSCLPSPSPSPSSVTEATMSSPTSPSPLTLHPKDCLRVCNRQTQSISETRAAEVPLPIAGVFVQDLGRRKGAWRQAMKQWHEPDPTLKIALKDWPVEWYKHKMRSKVAMKCSHRKWITDEYERLGGTDTAFLAVYPTADTMRMSELLKRI